VNAIADDAGQAARPPMISPRMLVVISLFGVYLLWGSTYLAIRIALADYPPFLMGAIRFLVGGVLMYAVLRWRGVAAPTWPQWRNCAVTGTLLLGFGIDF